MAITWAGLLPHPPIIVPAVGGSRCRDAQQTIDGCEALAKDFKAAKPDRLILLSPHTPRPRQGICAWHTAHISGDFANFGAPSSRIKVPNDLAWLSSFETQFPSVQSLDRHPLDHGACVPLYFLSRAGWQGPTVILGIPWAGLDILEAIGRAIKATCHDDSRTALLASGDMSHCLHEDGPYGFHELGPMFDNQFVNAVKRFDYHEAARIAPEIREPAKEDVLDTSIIAWTATDYQTEGAQFFSYQGPFGVGYTVMKFFEAARD